MIFQSFMKTMTDLSVEEIRKVGEQFNPDLHNAVMHIEDETLGENVVAQVLQKGYRIGERVVRYAMVPGSQLTKNQNVNNSLYHTK